jgi:hypothetical protein
LKIFSIFNDTSRYAAVLLYSGEDVLSKAGGKNSAGAGWAAAKPQKTSRLPEKMSKSRQKKVDKNKNKV